MKKKLVMMLCAGTMFATMPLTAGATEVEMEMMDVTVQESTEIETAEGLTVPALDAWEYSKDESTVTLKKYVGSAERIKVPATYTIEGKSYAVILENAFANNSIVKEVEFEKGVTYTGPTVNDGSPCGLFTSCTALEKASIPEGVTDCSYMFSECSSLTEVPDIPKGVTDCMHMFHGCSSLTKAPNIPEGVTDCWGMFKDCSSLTEAPDIPKGVTNCGKMFTYCSSLVKAPDIPEGVTNSRSMFDGCSKLAGEMTIYGASESVEYMFQGVATEGSGLTIYYADGVNIDDILATKSENSKITAKLLSEKPDPNTPTPTPASGSITSAGIYVMQQDNNGVFAGLVTESTSDVDKEYRWLCYDIEADTWSVYSDWTLNNEWVQFNPGKAGDYLLQGEVRCAGMTEAEKTDCIGVNHHPYIKGKCQMPYEGEGGGYLIGLESYDNADYQYEMLILDCTLLAEGKDAWTYTTGKCKVDGSGFWTIWQPEYGYYWTLFRVYDKDGNLIDQDCYGFENI